MNPALILALAKAIPEILQLLPDDLLKPNDPAPEVMGRLGEIQSWLAAIHTELQAIRKAVVDI